ncbi:pilus assembly protein [Thauera sp. WH-2]|uniref:pilus assembly protein n=1 Tax=Thauera sp. WH-2 TaxID=3401574 RepID=UPI003AAAB20B
MKPFAPRPIATSIALALFASSPAYAAVSLSDVPLFAVEGVPPNFSVTLDDSGSMAWAYVPDGISGTKNTKRGRSADFNPQYYNPNIVYKAPPGIPDVNGVSAPLTTSFSAAYKNGFRTASGTLNLATSYRVNWSYNPSTLGEDTGSQLSGEPNGAFYYVFDASRSGCNGTNTDEDCYARVTVSATSGPGGTDERQNFANWYSFYRTRNLATVAAASIAFAKLPDSVRVGWQALNSCGGFYTGNSCRGYGSDFSSRPSAVTAFEGAHRQNFYRWLQRLPASGGTPLLPSVERVETMFRTDRPYWHTPGTRDLPRYECRANVSLVMTDGIWNGNTASSTVGNADNTAITFPDGTAYSPRTPYASSQTRNLSDITFRQWSLDLRSDLPSSPAKTNIKITTDETHGSVTLTPYWNPKNDPSDWQNVVTYTLGVGLSGWLGNDWQGDTFAGAYTNFVDGTRTWPNTGLDIKPGNVYDLWHAAINGRGKFFSADSPDDAVAAFDEIIDNVLDRNGSAVAVSVSSPLVTPDALAYQVGFNTEYWSGALYAYKLSDGTGVGSVCNTKPRGAVCDSAEWEAGNLLNSRSWGSRKIITNVDGTGKAFDWLALSAAQQAALDQGEGLGLKRLEYLRGNRNEEGVSYVVGTDTITFRDRTSVLGDIMNSQPAPLHVGAPRLFINDASYRTFKTSNANRQSVIYTGANDGMLHAFNAQTGQELLAFVPAAVYPNLFKYTRSDYLHASYVDGGLTSSDVKIGTDWKTVLVGTLGQGGGAVYALDITDPAGFTEGNASNIFMWEFTDPDLGVVLGVPEIATLRDDRTVVIFPGGYNNGTGEVALFVVNIANGQLIKKIPVTNDVTSGLAQVSTVDLHGANTYDRPDGKIEYVVGGDLKGNLWVFDLTSSNSSQWGSAFKSGSTPRPAFIARDASNNRQPISSAPRIGRHPFNNGFMAYFGTGRYLGTNDLTDLQEQSFYAVWINPAAGSNTATVQRSELLQQEILFDDLTRFLTRDARATTQKPIDWSTHKGWFLDFDTEAGERVFQKPILRAGRIIFVSSTPSDNPCKAGGSSWIYELDAYSGARLYDSPFDYNGDGVINASDFIVITGPSGSTPADAGSGIRIKGDVGMVFLNETSIVDAETDDKKIISTASGGIESMTESKSASLNRTWRELGN